MCEAGGELHHQPGHLQRHRPDPAGNCSVALGARFTFPRVTMYLAFLMRRKISPERGKGAVQQFSWEKKLLDTYAIQAAS